MVSPAVTGLLVLVALAASAAALLRWARLPGWRVVGGVLAGVVLGPTIAGRAWPDAWEPAYVGGAALRGEADVARQWARGRPRLAPGATEFERETDAAWREARWHDQRPFRAGVLALVAATLLAGGALAARSDRRAGWVAPLSIGLWSALVPGGLVWAALTRWRGDPPPVALLAAAAVAIGPWAIVGLDRQVADRAELGGAVTLERAGRIAAAAAVALAAWAWGSGHGVAAWPWAAVLLAGVAGWLLPGGGGRRVRAVADHLLVPALAATVAVRLEVVGHFALWPVLGFVVVSGDGRWLGALLGALLPGGRRPMRTMRLVLGSMACGPTQLAVTAIAVHTGTLPPELAYALLAGVVGVEVTAPWRRVASSRLLEVEEEIEKMRDEEAE
ncbi:MAG: hypothetical protein ACYTG1_10950 [Planctomycetota bacterium]|jgi:hypothetical protein